MRKLSKLVLFMIFVMFVVTNKVIADTCVGKITESERSGSQVKETVTWNCDDPKYQNTCNFNIEIEDTKFILSFYCSNGKLGSATIYPSDVSDCSEVGTGWRVMGGKSKLDRTELDVRTYDKEFSPDKYYLLNISPKAKILPYGLCISFGSPVIPGTTTNPGETTKSVGISSGTNTGASVTKKTKVNPDHPNLSTYKTNTLAEPSNICTQEVKDKAHYYWAYIMVMAPIGLMILISVDFVKAITSGKPDALKKSGNDAVKRAIACIILLMLPFLLGTIFSWFSMNFCF